MKKTTKLFLTTFLTSGLLFGGITTIWDYIDKGIFEPFKIIFMTVFFGGFMAWRIVSFQKKSSK